MVSDVGLRVQNAYIQDVTYGCKFIRSRWYNGGSGVTFQKVFDAAESSVELVYGVCSLLSRDNGFYLFI